MVKRKEKKANTDLKKKKEKEKKIADLVRKERGREWWKGKKRERAVREDLICKTFYLIYKGWAYKLSLRDSISR